MDQAKIDRLERLARLRSEGALSDEEYASAKAALFDGADPIEPCPAQTTAPISHPEPPIDEAKLAPIWRERFRFMDEHGPPSRRTFTDALRQLPAWDRSRMIMAMPAILFGPFYLLYLGLWRPAISFAAATILFSYVWDSFGFTGTIDRVSYLIPGVICAWLTVPLYYLRVRRGLHSWNPLAWWNA